MEKLLWVLGGYDCLVCFHIDTITLIHTIRLITTYLGTSRPFVDNKPLVVTEDGIDHEAPELGNREPVR